MSIIGDVSKGASTGLVLRVNVLSVYMGSMARTVDIVHLMQERATGRQ